MSGMAIPSNGNARALDIGYQNYIADQAKYTSPSSGLVDPYNGDANTVAANLIQSQYANWQKNFLPIELQTLQQSSLNNPNVLPDAVNKAAGTATATADTMQGVNQRQLSGLSVAATPGQQQASNRVLNMSRASSVAGAENQARTNVAATDDMIALGGLPSVAK